MSGSKSSNDGFEISVRVKAPAVAAIVFVIIGITIEIKMYFH